MKAAHTPAQEAAIATASEFVLRQTSYPIEDLARGWSSWNFGTDGIKATKEQLDAAIENCLQKGKPLYISGFELWDNDLRNADIRELYEGYWVLVDNVNACGLSCADEKFASFDEAVANIDKVSYWGEGDSFCAEDATLVFSSDCGQYHVFAVK